SNNQQNPPQCSPASTTSADVEADATPQTDAAIAASLSTFNHAATALHQHHRQMDDQQPPTRRSPAPSHHYHLPTLRKKRRDRRRHQTCQTSDY
ncbi:hypothetical protein JI435_301950, partial [Parastagonospora nodorum SN15]